VASSVAYLHMTASR